MFTPLTNEVFDHIPWQYLRGLLNRNHSMASPRTEILCKSYAFEEKHREKLQHRCVFMYVCNNGAADNFELIFSFITSLRQNKLLLRQAFAGSIKDGKGESYPYVFKSIVAAAVAGMKKIKASVK